MFNMMINVLIAFNVFMVCSCQNAPDTATALSKLPNLVGYWPLTSTYAVNDARPSTPINGNCSSTMAYTSGPYGLAGTAFQATNTAPKRYIQFTDPRLNYGTNNESFTIAFWINHGIVSNASWSPTFEYFISNTSAGMRLSVRHPTSRTVVANSGGSIDAFCVDRDRWQFIAVTYNRATSTVSIYCDNNFAGSEVTAAPEFTNSFLIGYRIITGSVSNASYACLSSHSSALNVTQMWRLKDACRYFSVSCPSACKNGGTCVGYNLCFCPAGWTGLTCDMTTPYLDYLQQKMAKLKGLTAYWPLTQDFGVRDAYSLHQIDGYASLSGITYSSGPSGVSNTAIEILNSMPNLFLEFDNPLLIHSNASGWTMTFWLKSAPGSRLSFVDFFKSIGQSGLQIMQLNASNTLYLTTWNQAGSIFSATTNGVWAYVTCVFWPANRVFLLYSNSQWIGTMNNTSPDVGHSNRFFMGQRQGGVDISFLAQFACVTYHKNGLLLSELNDVGESCKLFSYECAPPCLNDGNCTGNNICTCPSGFTGKTCGATVQQLGYSEDQISTLPNLVAFWPLNGDYGLNDAKPSNKINGISVDPIMLYQNGPYGQNNGGLHVAAWGSTKRYPIFEDSQLNLNTSSWTWAGYFYTTTADGTSQLFLNFYSPTYPRILQWQFAQACSCLRLRNQNNVIFHSASLASVPNQTWFFAAIVYDQSSTTIRTFYDVAFLNPSTSANVLISGNLTLGYSNATSTISDSRYACLSAHNAALSQTQLLQVKSFCRYFHPVCSQPCQNGGTCVGFNVCNCPTNLWTGALCETPICLLPCDNGGTCSEPNTCNCTAQWTGEQCTQSVTYPLEELEAMTNSLPAIIGYWPMSGDFELRDAGPNEIDGVAEGGGILARVNGPNDMPSSAYLTGNITNNAYIAISSPLMNFGAKSWTLGAWVNLNGQTIGIVMLQWYAAAGRTANVAQFNPNGGNHANYLWFSPSNDSEALEQPNCAMSNQWQFIAVSYNHASASYRLFCNSSFMGSPQGPISVPVTTPTLLIARVNSSVSGVSAFTISVSCVSAWDGALNETQLITVKTTCPFFQSITCGPGCAPNSCRAQVGAEFGFTCDTCSAGWTGAGCSVATCSPACGLNQFCAIPNSCICEAGWTGSQCDIVLGYSDSLQSVLSHLPQPVVFWPFNEDFGGNDASGSGIHALVRADVILAQGPSGLDNSAMETRNLTNGYISANSSEFRAENSSWTAVMFANTLSHSTVPIFEFEGSTTVYARVWKLTSNGLDFYPYSIVNYETVANSPTCNSTSWHFIAARFNNISQQCSIYCDLENPPVTVNCTSLSSEPGLMIGARFKPAGHDRIGIYNLRAACYGIYRAALTHEQLQYAQQLCLLYNFVCPDNCAALSCYGNSTSPTHFSCSSCLPGYTGPQCDTPVCSPMCSNGGTCISPDNCSCRTGWNGTDCTSVEDASMALSSSLALLPTPIGIWPFNRAFGPHDMLDFGPDAIVGPNVTFTHGPSGDDEGAMETGTSSAAGLYFDSDNVLMGTNSWTLTMFFFNTAYGTPIIEYDEPPSMGAHIQQLWNTSVILFESASGRDESNVACGVGQWRFLALTYQNGAAKQCKIYCDNAAVSANCSSGTATTRWLLVGHRRNPVGNPFQGYYQLKAACLSLFSVALTDLQLDTLKHQCQLFQRCPLNCADGSCVFDANLGFSCSECKNGWQGNYCDREISEAVSQLRSLTANLPRMVGYWPMTSQFGLRDVSLNGIDGVAAGNSSLVRMTGPYGDVDGSYRIGNTSTTAYINWTSPQLNMTNQSFTLTAFVHLNGESGNFPLFQWVYHPQGAHLWQYGGANKLYFSPPTSGSKPQPTCSMQNNWQFIGVTFSQHNYTHRLFCNDSFISPPFNDSSDALTSNTLLGGLTNHPSLGLVSRPIRFSCVSLWGAALDESELQSVKQTCPLFSNITCSPYCVPNTCRPRIEATYGFICDACLPDWAEPDCMQPTCDSTCTLNAHCDASNQCVCMPGWTGANCDIVDDELQALTSIRETLPLPIAYWPFNRAFGGNDVSGNAIHADVRPGVLFAVGPQGNVDGAMETQNATNSFISLSSNSLFNFSNKAYTLSMFVNGLGSPSAPYIEVPNGGRQIWQYDHNQVLFYYNAMTVAFVNCSSGSWHFITFSYSGGTNATCKLSCDATSTISISCPSGPNIATWIRIGSRNLTGNALHGDYKMRVACYGFYDGVLTDKQLLYVSEQCELYSYVCPVNCAPSSCYYNSSNPGMYYCSECLTGWQGDTCNQTFICSSPCLNGGICIAGDVCSCSSSFFGQRCEQNLTMIRTVLAAETPSLISYWPLSSYFQTQDIELIDQINGTSNSSMTFTAGPFGANVFDNMGFNYVTLQSELLNRTGQSITVALWVYTKTAVKMSYFMFGTKHGSNHTYLIQLTANSLHSRMIAETCALVDNWQFIALSFNSAEHFFTLFCDSTFVGMTTGVAGIPLWPTAYIGGVNNFKSNASYACVSFYSSALTLPEILRAKDHCRLFALSCSIPCQNGGSCIGWNICSCSTGFTGHQCEFNLSYIQTKLITETSSIISYWPLNKYFSVKDIEPVNPIHGRAEKQIITTTGPFGGTDSSFDNQGSNYVILESPQLNLANQSFTVGLWVFTKSANAMPFFEFDATTIGTFIWQDASPNQLTSTAGSSLSSSCSLVNQWQYVALMYDAQTQTTSLFCGDSIIGYSVTDQIAKSASRAYIGYRRPTNITSNANFACVSFYSNALSAPELLLGKDHCRLFSVSCSQNCENGGSCVGTELCECLAGWTGRYCEKGTPSVCPSSNVCNCSADFTGATCSLTTVAANREKALLMAAFPNITHFWPLNVDHGLVDIMRDPDINETSSMIVHHFSQNFTSGPFGGSSSALDNSGPQYLIISSVTSFKSFTIGLWYSSPTSAITPVFHMETLNDAIELIVDADKEKMIVVINSVEVTSVANCANEAWRYVALVFDPADETLILHCIGSGSNSTFISTSEMSVVRVKIGHPNSFVNTSFACLEIHSAALPAELLSAASRNCHLFVTSNTKSCYNGGECISAGPQCSSPCEHDGFCSAEDLCTCLEPWAGQWCSEISLTATTADLLALSDEELLANIEPIQETVLETAIGISENIFADFQAASDMMTGLGEIIERFGNITAITPQQFNDLAKICAQAADAIMEAATNASEGVEQLTLGEGSMRCVIKNDGSVGQEITKPNHSPSLSKDRLREIFNKFMAMLVKMFGNLRQILSPGMSMIFSGQFYGAVVFNMRFGDLAGYTLETSLANAAFKPVPSSRQLFGIIPNDCPVLTDDTTIPVVLSAFIVNVMNIDQPFNMPTIAVRVYCSPKIELTLNKSLPMVVTAKPSVNKAEMLARNKVNAQCDISKTNCTRENADSIGSMASFPLTLGSGDFALIFPVIEFPYVATLMLGGRPSLSEYTWKLTVNQTWFNVSANSTLNSPEGNYGRSDLRLLIPEVTLWKYLDIDRNFKQWNLKLNVYMKRNFSNYVNKTLPQSACDLQRAYGYHLRIKLVENEKPAGRRKRDLEENIPVEEKPIVGSDNGFELMPESNESAVVFKSQYFGDFGADLVISPNTIEFTYIFNNFATLLQDNAAVFGFQVTVVGLFLIAVIFAFRFDKVDLREWAFLPIISNKPSQKYQYYVSVHYSKVKNYELDPRVHIRLHGTSYTTPWRMLKDGIRKNFEGKHPDNFIVSVFSPVGIIEKFQLSVESAKKSRLGKIFQMYLDRVVVLDAQTGRKHVFIAKSKIKSGEPVKIIELACEDQLKGYSYLVANHSKTGVTDIHPWLSIAKRPIPSNWTRVERLACVVSALFMAMLVNAMFYGREADTPSVGVKLGNYFTLSWFTIWTSFIGAVIVIPPTAIIAFIFKKVDRRSAQLSQYLTSLNMKLPDYLALSPSKQSSKGKKPFKLPFKCVFIAWFLVAACVGSSAFICIMYSLQWGRDKSLTWLSGMLLNVIQDIILIQPIKVLLTAVFSATMHSLPRDGTELGFLIYNKRNSNRNVELFKRLRNVIFGILHHAVYVAIFGVVIATMTNRYAYIQVKTLKQYTKNLTKLADPIHGTILDHEKVLDWMHDQLVPSLLNGNQLEYGGRYRTPKQLYNRINPNIALLGPIRVRQQRVSAQLCPIKTNIVAALSEKYGNLFPLQCQKTFGQADALEQRFFNQSWSEPAHLTSHNVSAEMQPWVFRQTDALPYAGWEFGHSSSSYWFDLPRNMTQSRWLLESLKSKRWLDNATSALFVDFNLFNMQTNLFVPFKIVFEALDAGGLTYHARMFPLQLYQYSGASSLLVFAVQGLWVVVLLSHVVRLGLAVKKAGGLKTFVKTDAWNVLDIVQILSGIIIVALFAGRIYYVIKEVTRIQTSRSQYFSLEFLANWEDLMFNLYGLTFFMTLMLFFRHLKFNKHWCVFIASLSKGKAALATFSAVFMAAIICFAALAYLIMGSQTWAFSSFTRACLNLIQGLIGVVDYRSLMFSRLYLGIVMLFSAVVLFIGTNIFITIIMIAYSDVTNNVAEETDWDADLSSFISKQLQSIGRKSAEAYQSKRQPAKEFKPIGSGKLAKLELKVFEIEQFLTASNFEKTGATDEDDDRLLKAFLVSACEDMKTFQPLIDKLLTDLEFNKPDQVPADIKTKPVSIEDWQQFDHLIKSQYKSPRTQITVKPETKQASRRPRPVISDDNDDNNFLFEMTLKPLSGHE